MGMTSSSLRRLSRKYPRRSSPSRPGLSSRSAMDETAARALIEAHFEASAISAPGGGPGDDIARASEIYADDAVVEWPQGGERIRGRAKIIAFRSAYPARMDF